MIVVAFLGWRVVLACGILRFAARFHSRPLSGSAEKSRRDLHVMHPHRAIKKTPRNTQMQCEGVDADSVNVGSFHT